MAVRRLSLITRLVLACLAAPTGALGQTIVWTDANARKIQKKAVSGGPVETIVQFPSPNSAYQIHYDPVTAKLHYTFYGPPSSFQQANLDGSNPETIPTPSTGIFTLNVDSRKLYWIVGFDDVLNYSELDGSDAASHTYPHCCVLTLEAFGDQVFFGAGGLMKKGIWRADPDGSNEQFLVSCGQPTDLAYDPVDKKLYVARLYAISRMDLDGTNFEDVVVKFDLGYPTQMVVDSWNRKLYGAYPARLVQRSNLDGSNVEDFVTASDAGNPTFEIGGLTIVSLAPLVNFARFQNCLGADPLAEQTCTALDVNGDSFVDLADYLLLHPLLVAP